jgi:hypothetical protein
MLGIHMLLSLLHALPSLIDALCVADNRPTV